MNYLKVSHTESHGFPPPQLF